MAVDIVVLRLFKLHEANLMLQKLGIRFDKVLTLQSQKKDNSFKPRLSRIQQIYNGKEKSSTCGKRNQNKRCRCKKEST